MAEGGLGRPRKEGDPYGFARFARNAAGYVWSAVAAGDEVKEQSKATRASRLAQLVSGDAPPDIWTDLKRHAEDEIDAALEGQFAAFDETPVDPNKVLLWAARAYAVREFYTAIDKDIVLGHAAMRRLSEKRLASGMAVEDAKENRDAPAA